MSNMKIMITVLALIFSASIFAQGKMYKVTDEYGNVSYQDTRPTHTDNYEESGSEIVAVDQSSKRRVDILLAQQNFPLTLFSIKKCDACDFVRWFLQNREIPFEELDVEVNVKNQFKLHEASGGYRVPTLMVGDLVQSGFDSETLDRVLADAGYIYPENEDTDVDAGLQIENN